MNLYAEKSIYNPPDPIKMEEAIASIHMVKPELLVILLAYHAGLGSKEMLEVKVSDIVEDFSFLVTPDKRKIPLTAKLADELKSLPWINNPDMPILFGKRQGRAFSRVHANNITRQFMAYAGMPEVHLSDLRTACIVNWMQQYPWEYVAQISGLEPRVLTQRYQHYLPKDSIRPKGSPINHTEITPDLIKSIFQNHRDDLFGLVLRLSVVHQLNNSTICNLTWDMVDDEKNAICLPNRDIPITAELRACLAAVRAHSNTNWVLAYPKTKTPYASDTISRFMSKTLVADGYAGITVKTLIRAAEYLRHKEIVKNLLTKETRFSVEDFVVASGLATERAHQQLNEMEKEGLIVQIGNRFYSAENVISPTRFGEVAQTLTEVNNGYFTSPQFAKIIGTDVRSATTQLRRMIAEGEVEQISTQKYAYKK